MPNTIIIKHRAAPGQPGAPAPGALAEGELAINLNGEGAGALYPALYVGGAAGAVDLLIGDSTRAIPAQVVALPSGGSDVGAAWAASGNAAPSPGQTTYASWEGSTYLLTPGANPASAGSWTPLGGTAGGAAVSIRAVNLGSSGAGPGDGWAATNPPAPQPGELVIGTWGAPTGTYILTAPASPTVNASWTALGAGGAYVPLTGGAMASGAALTFQPTAPGNVVINAAGGAIEGVVDAGTF